MSDSQQNRIVYITDTPFQDRDFLRFGVDKLRELDKLIEVWDLSLLIHGKKKTPKIDRSSGVIIFRSYKVLKLLLSNLRETDLILGLGVYSNLYSFKHLKVVRIVNKSKAKICTIATSSQPIPEICSIKKSHRQLVHKICTLVKQPQLLSNFVFRKLLIVLNTKPALLKPIISFRPLEACWICVRHDEIPSFLIGKESRVYYIHALDYDHILRANFSASNLVKYSRRIVFLDSMGPSHPDYSTGNYPGVQSLQSYRDSINTFLQRLETETADSVTIALHPKADIANSQELYGNREMIQNETCALVKMADFIVAAEASTSVGFAVFYRKPIFFLDSDKFELRIRNISTEMSTLLGMPLVNINESIDFSKIPSVDELKYKEYIAKYLKKPDTPEELFWDVVSTTIKRDLS